MYNDRHKIKPQIDLKLKLLWGDLFVYGSSLSEKKKGCKLCGCDVFIDNYDHKEAEKGNICHSVCENKE